MEFKQCNESHSLAGVIRGLHFQWNPNQGKMVRTIAGHIIDLALDIRKGSPTFGKIIAYDLPASPDAAFRRLDLAAARLRPLCMHAGEVDDRVLLFRGVGPGKRDGHLPAGRRSRLVVVRPRAQGPVRSHAGVGHTLAQGSRRFLAGRLVQRPAVGAFCLRGMLRVVAGFLPRTDALAQAFLSTLNKDANAVQGWIVTTNTQIQQGVYKVSSDIKQGFQDLVKGVSP